MDTPVTALGSTKIQSAAGATNPPGSVRFDWLMGLLALALIGGLNLDIWAHHHGRVDQSFFTPWHAVLYGSMALNGIILGLVAARNVLLRHYPLRHSLPSGYGLSLIGVIAFAIGGGLDLTWHTLFGIEEDLQALLSPTHLVLATSAALIVTGPIRSAAARLSALAHPSWVTHGPLLLSITATVTLLSFFTEFAHPLFAPYGAKDDRALVFTSLYSTRLDGTQQTRLIVDLDGDNWGAAVSADGKRLAYRRQARRSAQSDIYVANIDGTHGRRITHSGRHDSQPAWSPDGRSIAYLSAPAHTSGNFVLLVVPAAGGQPKALVSGATLNGPAWSPDGTTIAFGSRREQRDWIASIPVAGGALSWLAAGADGSWPSWRPDGSAIAFVHDQTSDSAAIFVMDAAGKSSHQVSTIGKDAYYPGWSPDGKKIAFTSSRDGSQQLFSMNADGSHVVNASRNGGLGTTRPAWASNNAIIFAGAPNLLYVESQNQSLGVGSFLLQTIVLMGLVLLLVRRWRVPLGAMTLILTLNGAAMVITSDQTFALPWIIVSGILADIALVLGGARFSDGLPFYAFSFGLPFLYAATHEAAIATHLGWGWPPNLALGTPVVCGVAGLLLAYAFRSPLTSISDARSAA